MRDIKTMPLELSQNIVLTFKHHKIQEIKDLIEVNPATEEDIDKIS